MKRLTQQLIFFAARHRTAVFTVLAVLGLLAAASLIRIRFTNDVSRMFPDSRDAGTTFRILNETRLGNTVQLEFITAGDIAEHEKYLDAAAEKIRKIPGVGNTVFRYRTGDPLAEIAVFTSLLTRFYGPEILSGCNAETAAENALKQLAFPAPGGVKLLRNQPFGLERKILLDLRLLDEMTGMKLSPDLPYFASPDRKRAMLVFDADLQIGDADAVRELLKELRRALEPLPAGMRWRVISGIMHTLGNEEVLKHDAAISGIISLLLFLMIFVICYRRDWHALWIPVIPLYASLLALAVMTVFFREICLYVIGLGSCITGLAIDQGIHVYAAFRGEDAERRTAALAEPMLLSGGTSVMVFIYLAFTGISAYIQLAVFAGLSLVLSCLVAMIVLPLLLDRNHRILELKMTPPPVRIHSMGLLILLVPLMFVCGKTVLKNANFSLDSLDGTPKKIRDAEGDFNRAWRKPGLPTAVLAGAGSTADEALTHVRNTADLMRKCGIPAAVPPVPPQSEQRLNRSKWRTEETLKRIAKLEAETRAACRKKHLPEKFFQPFFDRLRKSIRSDELSLPPMLESVMSKMVKTYGEKASAIALLGDSEDHARTVRKIIRKQGNGHCALLSKEGFKQMVREDLGGRFVLILPLSILSALLLAYLVFRSISDVLLAMVPVLVSFCGLFLLGALTGFRATPAAAFALILLTGLAIDYGIYAVSQMRHPKDISVRSSVSLSAATTIAGAGALVFSRHPALFGTGAVLSAGILLAALSGLYLVPMLKRTPLRPGVTLPAIAMLMLFSVSCRNTVPLSEYPDAEALRRETAIFPECGFRVQANAVLEIGKRKFSFILAGECEPAQGTMKLSGISGAGMLLFRMDQENSITGSGLPPEAHKAVDALRQDFRRIFLLNAGKGLAVEKNREYISLLCDDGAQWRIRPEKLVRKKGSYPFRDWECVYSKSGREVSYRSYDWDYTVRLTITKLEQKEKKK